MLSLLGKKFIDNIEIFFLIFSENRIWHFMLTSVAQLDVRPTGEQEVAGWIPAGCGNILSWRLIM